MADDDMFLDSDRLQKMIALGILDDDKIDKMKNIKNSDLIDRSLPTARPAPKDPVSSMDGQTNSFRDDRRSLGRGGRAPQSADHIQSAGDNWRGFGKKFQPISDKFKWSVLGQNKRPRSPSSGEFGFGSNHKMSSMEMDNKRDNDYNNRDRSTANDRDFRRGSGGDYRGRGMGRQFNQRNNQRPGFQSSVKPLADIDDFINEATMKLGGRPSPQKSNNSGHRSHQANRERDRSFRTDTDQRSNLSQRPSENNSFALDDSVFGLQSQSFDRNDAFSRHPTDRDFVDNNNCEPKENTSNNLDDLREAVSKINDSEYYCEYCDCRLNSMDEVNDHAKTDLHQQHMAKQIMKRNGIDIHDNSPNSRRNDSHNQRQGIRRTVVERVPSGMSFVAQMIEQKQQITLRSLIDMDSYEINSDSEASLAKELAKLLTNELLNYKMSLMPDNVKEALRHQGIDVLNSMPMN
ncbi:uncharacterized protein LOC128953559 isoform X2 [Oppia nitens]|uniref:uncharacterized protein LOC128953559 isoform X2 n=1 Tax=Oppia nitens TaxID=1686743 RepID=UPI0023DC31F4|nr:uncharacterized protein LOC128953559 isoform X2 [Oppia nitens]